MPMVLKTITTTVVICSTVLSAFLVYVAVALASPPDKLEAEYYRRLDDWVARGGPIPELQDTVVQTCGKLVMWTATAAEKLAFTTTRRDDFDYWVGLFGYEFTGVTWCAVGLAAGWISTTRQHAAA